MNHTINHLAGQPRRPRLRRAHPRATAEALAGAAASAGFLQHPPRLVRVAAAGNPSAGSKRTGLPGEDLAGGQKSTLLTVCLAMARNSRLKVDRDPATWQRLNAELRLPPNDDLILIRIGLEHSNKAQRRVTFDGHYLDGVRLTLARREPLP